MHWPRRMLLMLVIASLTACTQSAESTRSPKSSDWQASAPADQASPSVTAHGWTAALNATGPRNSDLVLESPEGQAQHDRAAAALKVLNQMGAASGEIVHLSLTGGELPSQG